MTATAAPEAVGWTLSPKASPQTVAVTLRNAYANITFSGVVIEVRCLSAAGRPVTWRTLLAAPGTGTQAGTTPRGLNVASVEPLPPRFGPGTTVTVAVPVPSTTQQEAVAQCQRVAVVGAWS